MWPSLKGNGPEAAAQTVVYGAIAIIFVPAVRRFIKRELGKIHAKIDQAHQALQAHHDQDVAERAELKRHLAHIISNTPGIPDLPPVGELDAIPFTFGKARPPDPPAPVKAKKKSAAKKLVRPTSKPRVKKKA